jgi:hypothetical protein
MINFKYLFSAQILNTHDLNIDLIYLSSKVSALHWVFDVQNLVLCLTRGPLQFLRLWNYAGITV